MTRFFSKTILGIILFTGYNLSRAETYVTPVSNRVVQNFNADWQYFKGDANGAQTTGFNDLNWTYVGLPHTTKQVTPDDTLAYLGASWYRKHFTVSSAFQGRKVFISFQAAMQVADVWVNGSLVAHHEGGYTPFTADVTALLSYGGGDNVVAVKVDSSPNANWAPGKDGIDFQYHGGIYRNVTLIATDVLHITDAVYADRVASGGVFVTYPTATTASATVNTKTHVLNESTVAKNVTVISTLVDADGAIIKSASTTVSLAAGSDSSVTQILSISSPHLWHPNAPYLYTLNTVIQDGTTNADYVKTSVGIRRIQWTHAGGLTINGSRFKARGADYHQDIFLLGNAMPTQAIYNDVKRIKDAGMDFVRGSHYPHDPAFYDACDKLGVLVMDSISGWQNFNDSTAFKNNTYQECQDMIRRDRNHPSVVVWETSLNESEYSTAWAQTINTLAHAEFPGDQMFTAGWTTNVFDIYCASSQSGVRNSGDSRPIIIDEYGSWDYGGINSSSDVAREDSESDLLQQCTNLTESLNSNLAQSWFSTDAYWVFGDYCGYLNNVLNRCGVVDFSRLPKFSYFFYKSQRDASITIPNVDTGPMVYIASKWMPGSNTSVRVFSNCQQVSLYLNDVLVATRSPDTNYPSLPHPPFTFNIGSFTSGTLRAVGLIGGSSVATYIRRTAGVPARIVLRPEGTTTLDADGGDARLVFIDLVDSNGEIVSNATNSITLSITGPGKIVGPSTITLRGGQLATWIQAGRAVGSITLTAAGSGLTSASANLTTVAVSGVDVISVPTAPTALTGSSSNSQVSLFWNDGSTNETSFVVEHSTDNLNFTTALVLNAGASSGSFLETSGSPTNFYRITARNAAGLSAPSNVISINVVAPVVASQWTYTDIGSTGATGSATLSSSTGSSVVSINGSGADIWNNSDAFGFYFIKRTGDFELVAHVASLTNTNSFAKAGIMIRETLATNSAHALADITAGAGAELIWRPSAGATSSVSSVAGQAAPKWLRLARNGNNFTAFYSADGITWNSIGSATNIPMGATVYLGLAVTSHSPGTLCTAGFDNIHVTQGGWTDSDIGAVSLLGNGLISGTNGATQASGSDIWNSADAFHYVYKSLGGNFAISSRVTSLTNTSDFAKGGVMIRSSLDPASPFGLVNLTPAGVAEFILRNSAGAGATSTSLNNQYVPRWVRLVRIGNSFRGYVSPDGAIWAQIGSTSTISMNSQVFVGIAATSHNNNALSSATFEGALIELSGSLGFLASVSSVSETAGSATIFVNRTSGAVGPISVNYSTTSGGTAVSGTHYAAVSGTLNWSDGDISLKSFNVPIYNDNVSGPNKTFAVALSSPTGGATLATSSQQISILENATQNWRFAKFGQNANTPTVSGDAADPDGDGESNLAEYALVADPNVAASAPILSLSFPSGAWKLDFKRNALANDVVINLEQSSDLTQWSSAMTFSASGGWVTSAPGATAVESSIAGSGVDQYVNVTINIPDISAGATPKQFFRLKVARP